MGQGANDFFSGPGHKRSLPREHKRGAYQEGQKREAYQEGYKGGIKEGLPIGAQKRDFPQFGSLPRGAQKGGRLTKRGIQREAQKGAC